jgi:predicted MFS family arabinose efflux permease
MPLLGVSHILAGAIFGVWGFGAFAFNPAQQARVVMAAPKASGVALSLNAAALYAGIAAGASLGGGVIAWRGTGALGPASFIVLVASMAFLLGSERLMARRPRPD